MQDRLARSHAKLERGDTICSFCHLAFSVSRKRLTLEEKKAIKTHLALEHGWIAPEEAIFYV